MDITEKNQMPGHECLAHWYYKSKYALLKSTLLDIKKDWTDCSLADVGCGMGVFLAFLSKDDIFPSPHMVGIDPGKNAPLHAIGGAVPIQPVFGNGTHYDVVLLMDVLEHVPDPSSLLASAMEHCTSGGYVFITVPAHKFLWSSHDVFLGHYRRYTLHMLEEMVFERSDCTILQKHYYYACILPMVFLKRWWKRKSKSTKSDMQSSHPWINTLLLWILKWELSIAHHNKVAGVTAVMLLKKV